jgi:hypothetical protein
MLQLEAGIRLLIAYGRCFTHSGPDEIEQAADILQPQPAGDQQASGPGAMSATGRRDQRLLRPCPLTANCSGWGELTMISSCPRCGKVSHPSKVTMLRSGRHPDPLTSSNILTTPSAFV